MPERPLILFPKRTNAGKATKHGRGQKTHLPSFERQVERLEPKMDELQRFVDDGKLFIREHPNGIEPESTLVLETTGDMEGLYIAIRHLSEDDGLADLFELSEEDLPSDNDFYRERKARTGPEVLPMAMSEEKLSCKLFCISTNLKALEDILSLWRNYEHNRAFRFPTGKTGLRNVFQHLRDIHRWGTKERLEETGVLKAWEEDLKDTSLPDVSCEIELHYRSSPSRRAQSEQNVSSLVQAVGGKVVSRSCIDAIAYHALLAKLPRQSIAKILKKSDDVDLVQAESIMFFRPVGQSVVANTHESLDLADRRIPEEGISDEPLVALFDGVPQENHPLLKGLLRMDDPDDYSSFYQVGDRIHGTSMASLIVNGDLLSNDKTVTRKTYCRPIMKPHSTLDGVTEECIPDDILLVDKIHEAVRRLYESDAGARAPSVRVINLSIGIEGRYCNNRMSPLARLLDWLSYKYGVLFIVSAGNHTEDIDLGMRFDTYKSLAAPTRDSRLIRQLDAKSWNLGLLSPAESMNSLTVGALFKDGELGSTCSQSPSSYLLLPCSDGLPNPISSIGRGLNRSIKPDLLYNGGRDYVWETPGNTNMVRWRRGPASQPPGILAAAPADVVGGGARVSYSMGTSSAAALISHEACKCYDTLSSIFSDDHQNGPGEIPSEYAALLLKAMLVHGAKWGSQLADFIRQALGWRGRAADDLHRWLGYGIPDFSRVAECAKNRVTLVGYGELSVDSAHVYEIPMPFDFHLQRMARYLTATLAYFSPIKPRLHKYRSASLWYTVEGSGKTLVPHRMEASDKAVIRGTLQHEMFFGDDVVVGNQDDRLIIKVSCSGDADETFTGKIPYSLFVTFEVAEGTDVDVYQKVVTEIKEKVPATVVAGT